MKNIHILTTTGASRLKRNFKDSYSLSTPALHWRYACYIYITSDQIFKEGDWCMDKFDQKWQLKDKKLKAFTSAGVCISSTDNIVGHKCKKIVLTNDPKLISNGVQEVDDEFLEWFIHNPTCDYVDIVAVDLGNGKTGCVIKKPTHDWTTKNIEWLDKNIKAKDLTYWKKNCEEDYLHTPISVLRYISELEKALNITDDE